MKEIRIYVEGGGDGKESKATFRQGMSEFLSEIIKLARSQTIGWTLVACGSRNDAFRNFQTALRTHPDAFNLLLVDAEDRITGNSIWQHLQNRDSWNMTHINETQCHLMVEVMENWLLADVDALAQFYGQNFNRSAIPTIQNVESISKSNVETALTNATCRTQKGEYRKIQHGAKLLGLVSVPIVRSRAPYCDRLFITLTNFIDPPPPE
ncbi:MAG: DUF4276 family protein [Leptolyngbyaceae cyanobacterium CRU_2_3]|nr:DUF4276 family protein [Leptolyngbyaceae cyanobacterium CRU_2_3]